ncbi:carbohydrate ABC transporter permease [Aristaeella hokkaidonensis]|uniref:carbohydrate ABC transporter permease n=1 Tax=Aristaeella hokkaidonensis TaxID=3046382 RepID=UPI000B6914D1|nr:carbohydrate ABC transporter permease [Aristaeella hokkaidonensis]SNT94107.1 carbohydrate ABC transporter membrane protein 2, CUT1 family [Aristaeella hokkaidonensis]
MLQTELAAKKRGLKVGQTRMDRTFDIMNYVILTICFLVVAYPLYFVVIASISDPVDVNAGRVILYPVKTTMDGYRRILEYKSFFTGYRNTLVYTGVGTLVNMLLTVPAAYALSRKDLVGRNFFMMMIAFTMIFSAGLIPTYLHIRDLGLIDTMWALILPGAVSTWNLIVARTFFQQSIPDDLLEAAQLDGATNAQFFAQIVLPLSKSILAVLVLFYAVGHWNTYSNALYYIISDDKRPLQLVLRSILFENTMGDMVEDASNLAAQQRLGDLIKYGIIIASSLPLMILYPFLQRYFIQGVMIGAVKG